MKDIIVNQDKLKSLQIKDKTDALTINHTLFSLPLRVLLISKSGGGKNTQLLNILCNDNLKYNKLFKGEHIYIFCPDCQSDEKMKLLLQFYDVPDNNIYGGDTLDIDGLKHVDDYSSGGKASSRFNIISTIFTNSRKYNINIFFLSQSYTATNPTIRSNANVLLIGNCSNKNLKLLSDEHNFLENEAEFKKMFRTNCSEKYQFFIINYTSKNADMYLNTDYQIIKHSKN